MGAQPTNAEIAKKPTEAQRGSAIISDCGRYRYRLERPDVFGDFNTAVIMVNPSTADASVNDATIRKLMGFRDRHGWGNLIVGNLFAFRATDVRELSLVSDPVGPENDAHLHEICRGAQRVIFAWGPVSKQPKYWRHRWQRANEIARFHGHNPVCIGEPAKDGHPKHPLMLAYETPLMVWPRHPHNTGEQP